MDGNNPAVKAEEAGKDLDLHSVWNIKWRETHTLDLVAPKDTDLLYMVAKCWPSKITYALPCPYAVATHVGAAKSFVSNSAHSLIIQHWKS